MCLVKKSIFPRFTLKDKVVYKIVYLNSLDAYISPFRCDLIELNKEYKGEWLNFNLVTSFLTFEIHDGYIHSIKTLEGAIHYIKDHLFTPAYILKAVIPKYTLYWEGVDNDIASRRIKYIDKIYKIHGNREEIYPCRMT